MFIGSRNLAAEGLDQIWADLELQAAGSAKMGFLTLRILPDSHHNIFLGVRVPENLRVILVRIRKENVINPWALPRFKGLEVRQDVLPEDTGGTVTVQLTLKDTLYRDIFSQLTQDVITSCFSESTESAMLRALLSRLKMWQQFLDNYGMEGLSTSAQTGLFGELSFLYHYLMSDIGAPHAISAWTGPHRKQQDFQMSGIAIEVKASTAKQHQKVTIASEQQLDDTGLSALYLYHLSLRDLHEGGETLPELIDNIRTDLSDYPESLGEFNNLLFMAGYLDEHRGKYEDVGYSLRNEQIFQVREGFPRITEQDLANGVGDVHYSVSLSACVPFILNEEDFRMKLEGNNHE